MPKTNRQDKVERFVEEYLVDLNGTQAYLRSHPGAAENTARTEASRLLAKPDIQEKIFLAKKARSKRTAVTQDKVVRELARIAFSDMRHFAKWGSRGVGVRRSSSLTTSQARAVSEISETKYGVKLKLHSKVRALEILLEHTKLEAPGKKGEAKSFIDLIKRAAALKKGE
jgi:phage terminase small subunit